MVVYHGVLEQQNYCAVGVNELQLLITDDKNFCLVKLLYVAYLNGVRPTELLRKM